MSRHTGSRFMLVVSALFAIYAILWGLAPYESINFPARLLLDSLDWPIDNLSTHWIKTPCCCLRLVLGY